MALVAVMVAPSPAVILPLLLSVVLWTVVATVLGARAGLRRPSPA